MKVSFEKLFDIPAQLSFESKKLSQTQSKQKIELFFPNGDVSLCAFVNKTKFDKNGELIFLSQRFHQDIYQQYGVQAKQIDSKFQQSNFFNSEISQFLKQSQEQPRQIHINQTPKLEYLTLTNRKGSVKGFEMYIPISENFQMKCAPINLKISLQQPHFSKMKNIVQAISGKQKKRGSRNSIKIQQIIMNDSEFSNSRIVEWLPDKEYKRIQKHSLTGISGTISDNDSRSRRNSSCLVNEVEKQMQKLDTMHIHDRLNVNDKPLHKKSINSQDIERTLTPNQLFYDQEIDQKYMQSEFDCFNLSELEQMRIPYLLLESEKYFEHYSLDTNKFCNFLENIKHHYNKRQNPFHNFLHGISVMQTCYFISIKTCASNYLNKLSKFSLILGGLCHDTAHTARTNLFEINAMTKLAIRYHDKSVLEQHHIAVTFKVLRKENCNFLENLSSNNYETLRKNIINNILATDIKEHFGALKTFEEKNVNWDDPTKPLKDIDRLELMGIITHASDFGGNAQKFSLSSQWSNKVNQEFMRQFKIEGELGITQTPYYKDLDKQHIMAKGEIGFTQFIVLPLWAALNKFLQDELKQYVQNLEDNLEEWKKVQEQSQNN